MTTTTTTITGRVSAVSSSSSTTSRRPFFAGRNSHGSKTTTTPSCCCPPGATTTAAIPTTTNKTVPRHDRHAQAPRDATKHERHDSARREPGRQPRGGARLARQVEQVLGVARRIADRRGRVRGGGRAGGVVVRGDGVVVVCPGGEEGLLELQGGLDKGRGEARVEVPLDVAVEEPDACMCEISGWFFSFFSPNHRDRCLSERFVGGTKTKRDDKKSFFKTQQDAPGLSATNRNTMKPIGFKTTVSRFMGTGGKSASVTLESANRPASSSDRQTTWKLWPCRWNGCLPVSALSTTTWTTWPRASTNACV